MHILLKIIPPCLPGSFRVTQVWNDLVLHLREKVELKRRCLKMRHYSSCFTGADAVDVVLHFLLSEKDVFSEDLSKENAVKVIVLQITCFSSIYAWRCILR